MTLIATAIGALVALLPRPLLRDRPEKANPRFLAGYDAGLRDGRLEAKDEKLARSHRQLVNHIESLEREILLEQHLCTHWREAAQRLARQSREAREAQRQSYVQAAQGLQAQQPYNQQQMQAHAQAQAALAQQAQLAYAQPGAGVQLGFCNCVPSRAQVWSEEQRRNLAAVGDRP